MEIRSGTYLQSFITISNEFLVQRHRILEGRRILRDLILERAGRNLSTSVCTEVY